MNLTNYPTMEDAWLDLRDLLLTGLKHQGISRRELISAAIEGIHVCNRERSENTADYFYKRAQDRRRIERRRAAGVCVRCGRPVDPGYSLCFACRQRDREYRERRAQSARGEGAAGS